MRYMMKNQNERQGSVESWRNQSKKGRHSLLASVVLVAILGVAPSGCCTPCKTASGFSPDPCPGWHEDAVMDLDMLIEMQEAGVIDIIDLEYQMGLQKRHCNALNCYLEDPDKECKELEDGI